MKLIHLIPLFWALVPASALGQARTPSPTPPLALIGVAVFDGSGAGLLSDATIVIVVGSGPTSWCSGVDATGRLIQSSDATPSSFSAVGRPSR